MPYQKTKEGRLVNEVTLGDGYPLSNDKQPLKVGGEASIINVSSPTPDGSVGGEVEVKGKLKAKDTFIQGDLKVFSDSDTYPQFVLQSKQGIQCQLLVEAVANSSSYVRIENNQGFWKINKPASTTSLEFTDGTNTPLILDGSNVDIDGTVSYKHTAFSTAGPTDNVDVSDTTVLEVDTSGGSVTIGGFTGGVQGQILYVVKTTSDAYTLKLENNEGGGSQDIYLSGNADLSIVRNRGGITLYCTGSIWIALDK